MDESTPVDGYEAREVIHQLTPGEKEDLAADIVAGQLQIRDLEETRKSICADLKRQIDTLKAAAAKGSKTYTRGWEPRVLDCRVTISGGLKTVYHPETGKVVERVAEEKVNG